MHSNGDGDDYCAAAAAAAVAVAVAVAVELRSSQVGENEPKEEAGETWDAQRLATAAKWPWRCE